jgi:transposase-like protein
VVAAPESVLQPSHHAAHRDLPLGVTVAAHTGPMTTEALPRVTGRHRNKALAAARRNRAVLPRVDGRHRNKALAAARRNRAVELRTQGWTYRDIAAELGYANPGTVYAIVRQALANQEAEGVERYRELEMARLDRLMFSLRDRIKAGEVSAIREARKISEATRWRFLAGRTLEPLESEPRTVVIRQG